MNVRELSEQVAKQLGVSKAQVQRTIRATIDTIRLEVKRGHKVRMLGFGTFELKKYEKRAGRNPQTGAEIMIRARKRPRFRAGKEFISMVDR